MSAVPSIRATRPAPPPCGSLHLRVNGAEVTLRRSGALWLARDRVLVAGDLHLEKGSSYAARGLMLPPYDTRVTLERLEGEVAALDPSAIVLLGDSFHDRGGAGRLAADDARTLARLAFARTLVWIVGNHDAEGLVCGPGHLPGEVAHKLRVAGLTLRHEPAPHPSPGEVCGHLHPCVRVSAGGRSVRRRAFLTDGERLILPAFGAFTGGLNALDIAYAGLFARPPLAGVLGERRVHAIPHPAFLGD